MNVSATLARLLNGFKNWLARVLRLPVPQPIRVRKQPPPPPRKPRRR